MANVYQLWNVDLISITTVTNVMIALLVVPDVILVGVLHADPNLCFLMIDDHVIVRVDTKPNQPVPERATLALKATGLNLMIDLTKTITITVIVIWAANTAIL